jgi:hypothetical protein
MDFVSTVLQNLLSPAILFFVLGVGAGWLKSDLEVPESISRYLSLYLMMSIGFKGGATLAEAGWLSGGVLVLVLVAAAMSFLQPFLAFGLLRLTTRLDPPTQAAIAGHYGSVSIVTFATAVSFLGAEGVGYAGYAVALLALMEAPAILSALFIAYRASPRTLASGERTSRTLWRGLLTNGAILLLFGCFIIGAVSGKAGLAKLEGFLVTPFQGILALFLLDMGLLVARQLHHMRDFKWPVVAFGLYMPLIGATLGLAVGKLLGLDVGTGTLFMVLCASASYIAVPAAMRIALPEARASIYLPLSLAITFPLNISLGIPFYLRLAQRVLG